MKRRQSQILSAAVGSGQRERERYALALLAVSAALSLPADAGAQSGHHHLPAPVPTAMQAVAPDAPGPPVLVNLSSEPNTVEVMLTAAPARVSLLPGVTTEVYAYNGRVPGPLLEVREGDRVIIRFRNNLPVETTVHWHGIRLPFAEDGSPFHPIGPGQEHDYVYDILPGSAGTYWYHPHPHHQTAYQVGMGLYAPMIVRAAEDPLASLPETLLMLSDNRFLPDGSLDFPDPQSLAGRIDAENGREGNVLFVNDEIMPTLTIRSGEVQRWRVINASSARIYRLSLAGHKLLHVGTDGGLFENPVEVDEVILGVSERAELLVRGTGAPGQSAKIQALPYDRYIPQTRPPDWAHTQDLAILQYTTESPLTPPTIPDRLRPIPPLDTLQATATRVMVLTQHLINGKSMDMDRVDVSASLGATEIWQIENLVGMDHPFHLHGFQFQVLDRNGVPEADRRWKDTVNLPRHQTARFVVRYDKHPGKWMFHCHILDHEDHGMMGILEVK